MSRPWIKDPDETLDFGIRLAKRLGDDTISEWSVTVPAGVSKVSDSLIDNGTTIAVLISGGSLGDNYPIIFEWTTANNIVERFTATLKIQKQS